MKLLRLKSDPNSSNTVESDDLIRDYLERNPLSIIKEAPEQKDEALPLSNGVLSIATAINIVGTIEIENRHSEQGLLYFDIDNQRLRLSTAEGWKTVKLV